jgi:protocatechuate 3,4-dioxygenase, alpha subunit
MTTLSITSSQTVGPFFADGLLRKDMRYNRLAEPETEGEHIRIEGHVFDGDGAPVPDALVEIWQADSRGRYQQLETASAERPKFIGFGRSGTDEAGRFWFETIKPGPVPLDAEHPEIMQAPHISVIIFARGLLNHLVTRLYFANELANLTDPILQRVPPERRATLLARPQSGALTVYHHDIILQGAGETAFFNL